MIPIDIDECLSNNGGCNQICVNTLGSYKCRCRAGFKMSVDNHNCTGRCNPCVVSQLSLLLKIPKSSCSFDILEKKTIHANAECQIELEISFMITHTNAQKI